MFRYLWAAFTARPHLPGLGAVPVNLLAVAAAAVLGVAQPAIWLAGLGLETAYLFGLASSRRFQTWTDAVRAAGRTAQTTSQPASVRPQAVPDPMVQALRELPLDDRRRYQALDERFGQIRALYRKTHSEDFGAQANEEALGSLRRTFAQLLVVRNDISAHWVGEPTQIAREIRDLEEALQGRAASEDLRRSRLATLEILRARLENQERKDSVLLEIGAELRRIEAEFDLALENAAISGKPYTVAADVLFDLSKVGPELLSQSTQEAAGLEPQPQRARTKERS
ncbi:MAG: hypothetical protein HZB55_23465 [Deltaproteobacteria bacterium]|nr:hypothetical protein [Deltaproteobacteria bacterium]